ncbi:MAG: hypothetical protein NTW57_07535 [Methylophilales bacterium]|nr:hypothetical protein [Methylophilales bacterium]
MKKIMVLAFFGLSACVQLQHGSLQPVTVKNLKEKIYFTTCSGVVETTGTCYDKAKDTCEGGYNVLERYETPTGGRRELTFQCKK